MKITNLRENKRFIVGGWSGVFIFVLLMCFTIYFTPNFVANNLSSDGVLVKSTISLLNFIRLTCGILSTIGLLISVSFLIKPNLFLEFYSYQDQVWKKLLKLIIFCFPIVFVICAVFVKYNSPESYYQIFLAEDSFIEWLTFLSYFIAFIVSCSISITFYRSNYSIFCFFYVLLSIGFFFIAMEEISWGQRLFSISVPELFLKYNKQEEMNIHNFKWFPLHGVFMIIGFYGAFSRFIVPRKVKIKYASTVDLFVPDYYLFFYFFIVLGLYLYYDHLSPIAVSLFGDRVGWGYETGQFMHTRDQEPAEFFVIMWLFVVRYN